MMADCKSMTTILTPIYQNKWIKSLLDSNLEAQGKYIDPRYMGLLNPYLHHQHICRLTEWPDTINRTFAHLNGTIYTLMRGPQSLASADGWKTGTDQRSSTIKVPT